MAWIRRPATAARARQESLAAALTNGLAELARIGTLLREEAERGPVRLAIHRTRRTVPARSRLSEILEE